MAFLAAAFFAGAFLVAAALGLLTRPALVFFSAAGVADGAWGTVSHTCIKGISRRHTDSVLVLVLGARLVAVLALGFAAAAFLGAAAFFTLVAAVLGLTAVLALVALGLASLVAFSFWTNSQWRDCEDADGDGPWGRRASSRRAWPPSSTA